MKIRNYILHENNHNISGAVEETMALFGVVEKLLEDNQTQNLDTVLVKYTIEFRSNVGEVITDIGYWSGAKWATYRTADFLGGIAADSEAEIRRLIRLHIFRAMHDITGYSPGPWGILRGVRPTKIVHRLLEWGLKKSEIISKINADYGVDVCRAELLVNIALRQRPFFHEKEKARRTVSIYIGVPYCPTRCLYCSFPGFVLPDRADVQQYLKALEAEIIQARQWIEQYSLQVESVYVGGGTPTSLHCADLTWLLDQIKSSLFTTKTIEFTLEAGRPDSVDREKITVLKEAGVTRTSVNPQTMQEKTLKRIGRQHTVRDIIDTFEKIRLAGIPVINMDVIAGLPGETEDDMADTMQRILQLSPDNLTVHTLAIKRGSRLKEGIDEYQLPNQYTTAKMLQVAADSVSVMGMEPYYLYRQKYMTGNFENIGYSKSGCECIYNIQIMEERQTIIGIGSAATTKVVDVDSGRFESVYNPKDIVSYMKNLPKYLQAREKLLSEVFNENKGDNRLC